MRNKTLQLFIFLSLIVFAQNSKAMERENLLNDDAESNYRVAIKYTESGRYLDAITSLGKAIKLNNCYAKAQYALGYIYEFHVKDSVQDAVKWYTFASVNDHKGADAAIVRVLGNKKGSAVKAVSDDKKRN